MLEFDRVFLKAFQVPPQPETANRGRFWTLASFSLLMEAMGQRLLDFSQPFDVTMLDQVVHTFHSGGPEVRREQGDGYCLPCDMRLKNIGRDGSRVGARHPSRRPPPRLRTRHCGHAAAFPRAAHCSRAPLLTLPLARPSFPTLPPTPPHHPRPPPRAQTRAMHRAPTPPGCAA